jgi:hypothetical protein
MIELQKSENVLYSPQGVQKMSSKLTTEEFLNEEYSEEGWWLKEGYANPDDVPVPDWHIAILEERMARYETEPVEWIPWEEIKKDLMQEVLDKMKSRTK